MSELEATKTRFFAGSWEGVITGTENGNTPAIEVSHLGKAVEFSIINQENNPEIWVLKIPVPPELLSDGVQVFLINNKDNGKKLTSFTIVTGEPLDDDIRAESELLRAELDMLKRAFRRHCLETK
ncbi:MAG: hypothetical protein V3V25_01270 [Paracoccaceae bacterium]